MNDVLRYPFCGGLGRDFVLSGTPISAPNLFAIVIWNWLRYGLFSTSISCELGFE
jgi:hypothetical protein